jgi:hypothetical protein
MDAVPIPVRVQEFTIVLLRVEQIIVMEEEQIAQFALPALHLT